MKLQARERDGKWGYVDARGRWVIKPRFDYADDFLGEPWARVRIGSVPGPVQYGIVSADGRLIVPVRYDDLGEFSEGLAWFLRGRRKGFVDRRGREVIAARFEAVDRFTNGAAAVQSEVHWGIIDRKGSWLFRPTLDESEARSSAPYALDISRMAQEGLSTLVDRLKSHRAPPWTCSAVLELLKQRKLDLSTYRQEFKKLVKRWSESAQPKRASKGISESRFNRSLWSTDDLAFHAGLAAVEVKGKWGFVNRQGRLVIPARYDFAGDFHQGSAIVRRGWNPKARFGLIDKRGREMMPCRYEELEMAGEGRLKFTQAGKIGFMDRSGRVWVKPELDEAEDYSEGRCVAREGRLWGFLDPQGRWVIPPTYTDAHNFHEGLAAVQIKRRWGFINKACKIVIAPRFQNVQNFYKGKAMVNIRKLNGRFPLINRHGKIIGKGWWD